MHFAYIDWSQRLHELNALLLAAPELRRIAAQPTANRLAAYGAVYEQFWTLHGAAVIAADTTHQAALSAWQASIEASGSAWSELNRAVRYLEGVQLEQLTGTQLDPSVFTTSDGARNVLAPTLNTSLVGDGLVPASASRTLDQRGTPILRVSALQEGTPGNDIQIGVEEATNKRTTSFDLVVTYGSHTERFQNLDATTTNFDFGEQSLLINAPRLVGLGRPGNCVAAMLTGGQGDALAAIEARVATAKQFPVSGSIEKTWLDFLLGETTDSFRGKPSTPAMFAAVAKVHADLTTAMSEAERASLFLVT